MDTRARLAAAIAANQGQTPAASKPPRGGRRRRRYIQEPIDLPEFDVKGDYPGLDCEIACNDCTYLRRKLSEHSAGDKAMKHARKTGHSVRHIQLGEVIKVYQHTPYRPNYDGPPPF